MSIRLNIVLYYKDGSRCGLEINCPPDVAAEIERKGLVNAKIAVDRFMQFPNSKPALEINNFKKDGG